MAVIQLQNRGEMRRSVGRNLGIVVVGAATSTVDTSSLIDGVNLRGGDDEHNEKQVMIYDAAGSIVDGETSFVSDYTGATWDATISPAFTAAIADGDKYEMWDTPWFINDINDVINQAIMEATRNGALKVKQTASAFTMSGIYEYSCLSSFVGLYMVEYVSSIGEEVEIDDCDSAWTAGTNATVTADTTYKIEGTASNKIVVVGAGANEELAYNTFSAIDLSDCDEVEISIYSTIALVAGYVELRLDDTAGGGSAVESLDIPATTANVWTRHKITLANPLSDTAIVRASIHQVTDQADCTIYIDYIKAVKSTSRVYKELNPRYWSIVRGSTNYLKLTPDGLSITGNPTLLRLNGFQIPALFSDDTTDSDIDPAWLINYATGRLLIGHAKSSRLDIEDKAGKAKYYLGLAEAQKSAIRTNIPFDFREI